MSLVLATQSVVKELQALGIKVTLGASDGTGVELIDAGGNNGGNGGEV